VHKLFPSKKCHLKIAAITLMDQMDVRDSKPTMILHGPIGDSKLLPEIIPCGDKPSKITTYLLATQKLHTLLLELTLKSIPELTLLTKA
jgi:hypothetical protein